MELTADQVLRKELLLFALTKQPDLAAAFAMAAKMERFVLDGPIAFDEADAGEVAAAAEAAGFDLGVAEAPEEDCVPGPYGSGGTKRRWSEEDDATLKTLWHSPASLEEIAETLERTTPSLYCRARALGLAKRAPQTKAPAKPVIQPVAENDGAEIPADKRPVTRPGDGADGTAAVQKSAEISELNLDRYRSSRAFGRRRLGQARPSAPMGKALKSSSEDLSVDSIVQFLRSRDYSVVRVSEGRFRLDGRRELSVDELRDKANKVREMLGQPPFVLLGAEAVNY